MSGVIGLCDRCAVRTLQLVIFQGHWAIGCAEKRSALFALLVLMRLLRRHILYELPISIIFNPLHSLEKPMNFSIECEQEQDGRWLAEVPELPGVLAYGANTDEAMAKAEALALRVLAERLEQGESRPMAIHFTLAAAA